MKQKSLAKQGNDLMRHTLMNRLSGQCALMELVDKLLAQDERPEHAEKAYALNGIFEPQRGKGQGAEREKGTIAQ